MFMPKPRWLFDSDATDSPQNPMIVINGVLSAVVLLTALLADLAVLRVMDRMVSVVVVGALLTVGLLLPEPVQDGPLGRKMWNVGTIAAWMWVNIALVESYRRYGGDLLSGLGTGEGGLRLGHVVLAGVTAILSTFIGPSSSTTASTTDSSNSWVVSIRRATVGVAVATVLVLPSGHFADLPWQTRTNDAVHAAAAITWLAGLLGVLYIAFVRVDAMVGTDDSKGADKDGVSPPPGAAFANLKHAANRFSDLVGLPVSLAVVVTGVAMVLGVAQYVGGAVFFQDFPWGWGWMAMWKIGAMAIVLACAAVHRTVTLKILNGDPIDGVGAVFMSVVNKCRTAIRRGSSPATGPGPAAAERDGPARPQALAFRRLAAVEVAVLLFAGALGTSMNLAGIPQPSTASTAPAVVIEDPGPGRVHSPLIAQGTAHLQPDSQMWLVVEDLDAGVPYYLATDAPVAVDGDGQWESRVTLGTGPEDIGRHFRLTAIVVADRHFDDAIADRPPGEYSVRLSEYPGGVQARVDVVVDSFGG